MRVALLAGLFVAPSVLGACSDAAAPEDELPADQQELGVGTFSDEKSDGTYGSALTCKPIPNVPALVDPAITISLDGLTLHLVDRAGTYDRVFPIGPGAIEKGVSLTPVSTGKASQLFYTRTEMSQGTDGQTPSKAIWSWNYRCRIWWKDTDTGKDLPVFAGLPFIRLEGPSSTAYGIHGPIDNYTAANGGTLRRGFVSHGCVRMDAVDVVELYARIQGKKVPVRIQQAIERTASDAAVDLPARWIGSECKVDSDCNFTDGFCHTNAYSGRSFCSARCTKYCTDRANYPPTFCVADPASAGKGMCVTKSVAVDNTCRRYDHMVTVKGVPRIGQATVKADVCLPGTEGWIGDRCFTASECKGGTCALGDDGDVGTCTAACTRYCPDLAGSAGTFCIDASDASGLGDGMCAATCTRNDDCAVGTTCETEPRFGQTTTTRTVCLPE